MSTFSTQRESLLPRLNMALPVVGKDSNNPIVSHVLIRVSDNICEVLSTDKKLATRIGFKLQNSVTEDVSFAVDAKKISDFLKVCDNGEVTFTYDDTEKTVEVLSEPTNTKVVFNCLDAKDFPKFESHFKKAKPLTEFKKDKLLGGLVFVEKFVASANANDPAYTLAAFKEGSFSAGTGRSLGKYKDKSYKDDIEFKLRGVDLGAIRSWIKQSSSDDIEMLESPNYLFFKSGNSFIGSVKTDVKPPNIQIPTTDEEPHAFNFAKADLIKMISRLRVASAKDNARLDFSLVKDATEVKGVIKNEQGAESTETMEITLADGEGDTSFALDYGYLERCLEVMDNAVVTLRYDPKKKYVKLVADTDDAKAISFLAVLR